MSARSPWNTPRVDTSVHDGLGIDVRIADVNWMQVEEYLRHDYGGVLPWAAGWGTAQSSSTHGRFGSSPNVWRPTPPNLSVCRCFQ